MGRPTVRGIYPDKDGRWHVDKVFRGNRLPRRSFETQEAAEGWVIDELARLKGETAVKVPTFDRAAAHYITEHEDKLSIETEVFLLETVMPFIGQLPIDQVHDGTLKPYVEHRKAQGRKAKTINLALGVVRRILNLAARKWRDAEGRPWLRQAPPLLSMLPLVDQRDPMQLTWEGQRRVIPELPGHLGRMVLFDLQCGARDNVVCNLRWQWEVRLEVGCSAFVVPREYVKGRKRERVLVCNSVAQSIVDEARGEHDEFVFTYRRGRSRPGPITAMDNTAWQNGTARAGWPDLHVHDLRHTVGMRLREAGVIEETRDDILWHKRPGMPAHYSVAQVVEIREALELITSERHAQNVSLASLVREKRLPAEVPTPKKAAA